MKKTIWLLLLATLFLTSCGRRMNDSALLPDETTTNSTTGRPAEQNTTTTTQGEEDEEPRVDPAFVGRYVCVARYRQGENYGPDESWYELRADGTGTEFFGSPWKFTWESEGNTIRMTDETGRETLGVMEGDTLTVEDKVLETKNVYSRKTLDVLPTESTAPTETAMPTEAISQMTEIPTLSVNGENEREKTLYGYWNRSWYGWWVVEEGFGTYAAWGDGSYWWDCCADITWEGNHTLQLTLWDEDGSRQDPMAEATLRLDSFEGRYGTAYSTAGTFWKESLEKDEWRISPDDAVYDELLILEGYYSAPAGKGDGFYYTVYLRPWGKLWDDWYAEEADCLPASYESWYLPKLKAGLPAPPDRIG